MPGDGCSLTDGDRAATEHVPELGVTGPGGHSVVTGTVGLVAGSASRKGESVARQRRHVPVVLGAPFFILYAAFFLLPLVYAIMQSTQSPLTGAFVGDANYRTVFQTGGFWQGFLRMTYFSAIEVTVMLCLAAVLALLLDSRYSRGRTFFSLAYFLPYAVPGVVAAILWGFILFPETDSVFGTLHVHPLTSATVLYVLVAIVVWEGTGYNMTLYLASLASVRSEILDAARIDGCGEVRLALSMKLPAMRSVIVFTAITSVIATLQLFTEPLIISSLLPLSPSYTPNFEIYNTGFIAGNLNLAAAQSLVFGAVIIVGGITLLLATRGIALARSRRYTLIRRRA